MIIDETHDPELRSWVESANTPDTGFPIQNLPLGVFRQFAGARDQLGVGIGDSILGLSPWLSGCTLNKYLELSATQRRDLRREISRYLTGPAKHLSLVPQREATMRLPVVIGDYTDFYASIHHATNVGRLLRPDQPLLPNYKWMPIAYHGRSSSIVVSGTPIRRPQGQLGEGHFGPSRRLDLELEVGAFLGPGTQLGEPVPITHAEDQLAGLCLLNDWSARDIQRWEYQPLGPFLAKNFATSISPWVITAEALAPFRCSLEPRAAGDPEPLPYLQQQGPTGFDLTLEVWLQRSGSLTPERLSRVSFSRMYWSFAQMIAHHTSNGCPLRAGDLIGSGTVSGPGLDERGCLLETPDPRFLEDGDQVILRGYAERSGFRRISFGECSGVIFPAA